MRDTSSNIPLCVDLDYTLLNTDLTLEALIECFKKNPYNIFIFFKYLIIFRKDLLKIWIASEVSLEWDKLPKNAEVVKFIEDEARNGRQVIIVSGSDHKFVTQVHRLFPFVSEVVGSYEGKNLIGKNKAQYLSDRFGVEGFDYVGDSSHDVHVWKKSRYAHVVSRNGRFIKSIKNNSQNFHSSKNTIKHVLKGIRVSQWVKNLLIFLPAILGHKFYDVVLWGQLFAGVILYSLVASSIYLLNDIIDIPNDRNHRTKQFRPIASGNLEIILSIKLIISFLTVSMIGAYFLNKAFLGILLLYFVLNLAYSLKLKKLPIIDIFLLSSFYLIRIVAGSEIGDIPLSPWLKSFAFFLFLSLGFLKRYTEVLLNYIKSGLTMSPGRAYVYQDSAILLSFGVVTSYMSVLILSLYIYHGQVDLLYSKPDFMWGIVILLGYWISSLWFKASHGKVKDDPVKYILTDRASLIVLGIVVVLYFLAI